MNLTIEQTRSCAIVYDADCIQQPVQAMFDEAHWRRSGAVSDTAAGRGAALMLETDFGPAVMRTYRRGGWPALISRDRYLFTGFSRSRPLHEVRMLAALIHLGLPVPQPIAGRCLRHGLTYSAVLLTRRIMPASPLAELLRQDPASPHVWLHTGQCIRRFHDAGLVHPDLHARNILIGEHGGRQGDVYLVDFDRAFFRHGASRLFRSNLRRLHRSLLDVWPVRRIAEFEDCWGRLLKGYNGGC